MMKNMERALVLETKSIAVERTFGMRKTIGALAVLISIPCLGSIICYLTNGIFGFRTEFAMLAIILCAISAALWTFFICIRTPNRTWYKAGLAALVGLATYGNLLQLAVVFDIPIFIFLDQKPSPYAALIGNLLVAIFYLSGRLDRLLTDKTSRSD
jgi:hypothetical protein